jgi:hypothetical protein
MPTGSTSRRPFAHCLELGGNLLQRAVRRGGFDTGDQPDQPIVARLRPSAVDQADLEDAFANEPADRAAQPLSCPLGGLPAVEHTHHVTPRLVRAHPPDGR